MDATCNVQDSIHVFHLVHNMCPGFWVHIIERLQASFYIRFIYSWSYIIIGDEKGGDSDEDISNQSYFI